MSLGDSDGVSGSSSNSFGEMLGDEVRDPYPEFMGMRDVWGRKIIVGMDAPEHHRHRALVSVVFRARLRRAAGPGGSAPVDRAAHEAVPERPDDLHPRLGLFDDENGRVVSCTRTHMPDLGDGREYSTTNWSMIDHAGNGQWSREEDIYNPAHFGTLLTECGNQPRTLPASSSRYGDRACSAATPTPSA